MSDKRSFKGKSDPESSAGDVPPVLSPHKSSVSEPGSASVGEKRGSSLPQDTPPVKSAKVTIPKAKLRGASSGEHRSHAFSPVKKPDFATMINIAFAATFPSFVIFITNAMANSPATALSAGGEVGGGIHRSVLPSATVTSGALGSAVTPTPVTTGLPVQTLTGPTQPTGRTLSSCHSPLSVISLLQGYHGL